MATTETKTKTVEIHLAHTQGFCAGVSSALKTVELAMAKYGTPLYVRHHIVHNTAVIKNLEKKGVVFIEDLKDVPRGNPVIFSAHGVAPQTYEQAKELDLHLIDATCPLVTKVHMEAKKFSKNDVQTILIGHQGHQELIGTSGYVKPDLLFIVETVEDVAKLEGKVDPDQPIGLITQTTLSVSDTKDIIVAIKERFPNIKAPKKEDICFATQNRQDAVKELAELCEIVIVCGSPESSNSNRLRETAEKEGVESYIIDFPDQLEEEWIEGKTKIGITSGASVPLFLVEELVEKVKKTYPAAKVFQKDSVEEGIEFGVPKI